MTSIEDSKNESRDTRLWVIHGTVRQVFEQAAKEYKEKRQRRRRRILWMICCALLASSLSYQVMQRWWP